MRSHTSSLNHHCYSRLGLLRSPMRQSFTGFVYLSRHCSGASYSYYALKLNRSNERKTCAHFGTVLFKLARIDEDSYDISSLDDWDDNEAAEYLLSLSDGEDVDVVFPVSDLDLPTSRVSNDGALTLAAHRLAMTGRGRRRHRIYLGVLLNLGLVIFLVVFLLFVDSWGWKVVRLPLAPFYLTRPFLLCAFLASCAGYVCVPMLKSLRFRQIIRKGPARHSRKRRTPTMGGLFFIPVGVCVAKVIAGSSTEVSGAAAASLAFAAIGLLDDNLSLIKKDNGGFSPWLRLLSEASVGIWFSFWLDATSLSSPYSMKMLVPLPEPLGLVCLGKCYLWLTSFCFVSMSNGVNLTDGLDGLAGGTAALTFVGMSIAVLAICPELAIFGAAIAGACVGFLLHNQYKASVFMGDTESLALGGALAAMAAFTGMFFPLFISSGIFVVESSSVILQVLLFKTTKCLLGSRRRLFRMAPFDHHLELCKLKEPVIVAGAYLISSVLALLAGYVGLISV
ncbi:hypothetical protein SLE2022_387410 [Rubroshorea leprosula]